MSVLNTNRAVPLGSITLFRLVSLVERSLDLAAAWRSRRETRRQLSRLTDDQLDDIGLDRADILRLSGAR